MFGGGWVNDIVKISAGSVPLFLRFLSNVPLSNGAIGMWGNACWVSGCGYRGGG